MYFYSALLSLVLSVFSITEDSKQLREEFKLVGKEERAVTSILAICAHSKVVDAKVLKAYEAAAKLCSAKYQSGPFAKFSTFNAGRALLDLAVANDSLNPEVRYLRYTIQANAPAFLGYQKNLKSDRALILKALPNLKSEDPHLYAVIQAYFLVYESNKK